MTLPEPSSTVTGHFKSCIDSNGPGSETTGSVSDVGAGSGEDMVYPPQLEQGRCQTCRGGKINKQALNGGGPTLGSPVGRHPDARPTTCAAAGGHGLPLA